MTLDVVDRNSDARTLEFAHMVLQVGDIEASKHFYLDLLGMTPRPAIPLADGRPVVPFKQGIALACRNYPANFSGIFPGIWIFLLPKVAKKAWRFLRKV